MIAVKNLSVDKNDSYFSHLSLEVREGEIYFLLNRMDQDNDVLFRVLGGFQAVGSGEIFYDGIPLRATEQPKATIFIERIKDRADFDAEAALGHWLDFLCAHGLDRESIYKTLLVGNFHERQLKRMVRDLTPEAFKLSYLAACLAADHGNIVINDFVRGAEKSFELKFNKLLLQQKVAGNAILFLGGDIFYAAEIADRVGFIKNGRLIFEAAASDLKEMDIKDLYSKFFG